MRVGRRSLAGAVALIVLIASLAGLWRVLMGSAEVHLSGETLLSYARIHPPKPWHGFEIDILDVSVDGKVHIKAHVSGHMIHTPVEVTGAPEYDADSHAMFFHVTDTRLPRDSARPMLSRFNAMLNPLATYIAQNLTDVIPVKRIKEETRGGALFLTTVKSVRVESDAVVLAFHRHRIATAASILALCALLSAAALLALWLRAERPAGSPDPFA